MTMQLHLQQVPAANGRLWIRHGFKIFRRQPLAFSGLLGLALLASMLLGALPFIGPVLGLMAIPVCSLGFMLATHLALQRKTPSVEVFVAPFKLTRERRRHQLVLCIGFALAMLLILLLSDQIDGEVTHALMTLMKNDANSEAIAAVAADPRLIWGFAARATGMTLLSIPYWHAPALVHWGGQSAAQALFSSTLALWRNKGAFALNALLWAGLAFACSGVISIVFGLLGLLQLAPVASIACFLVLMSVFYASLYFSFVDCFMFGAPQSLLDDQQA
ncbi:hypothetical protein J2X20_001149 [Pelomonas saccharophila]|uniref:Transmembrane protein n=1 Tax=Roseateles saccharophilus TaxID=304 RepID=A0ABU1YJZ6_ROSSA|nr:BPSS1780 family membrane protein [Roseateles saccharophilus]MDR7268520.1 hypothetical protein [Roseateles saccharophilus]